MSDKSREDTSHGERFFVVAVDGPAASGKGTIAAYLAKVYDLPVLDTGLLYRAVGVLMRQAHENLDDEAAACAAAATITADQLSDPELRTRAAGELASRVAIHPRVRNALMEFQRTFAQQEGGAVLDGRDIGTVIAPDAPAKLFVTATPEVRAGRRWRQLTAQGEAVAFEDVLADIRTRDARDGGREQAPMRPRGRRRLAGYLRNDYRAGRRCGPPHRRGGARDVGTVHLANPTAPFPRTAAGRFHLSAGYARAFGSTPNPTWGLRPTACGCAGPASFERQETLWLTI